VRVRLRTIAAALVSMLAGVGPTMALQSEVQQYYDSMKDICRTGVTPEMTAGWKRAQEALDRARDGAGRNGNNFAGIKSPTDTWLDCFQSPGDGKF
jgi:hypothetical protein